MLLFTLILAASSEETPHLPEAWLIDPLPRSLSPLSQSACSVKDQKQAHILAETDSLLPLTLEITHPSESSNCTVKLVDIKDQTSFVRLLPLDSVNTVFPCGRDFSEQETLVMQLPYKQICRECMIELIWRTYQGDFYECADLILEVRSLPSCEGLCQNDGKCSDQGFCVCKTGFSGQFCDRVEESEETSDSHLLGKFILFLFLFLVLSIIGAAAFYYMNQDKLPEGVKNYIPQKLRKKDESGNRESLPSAGDPIPVDINLPMNVPPPPPPPPKREEAKLQSEAYGVRVSSHSRQNSSSSSD